MPPTRTAQRSGRTAATRRAASVPVSRLEKPKLESLRLKRQRSPVLNDEDTPSSLPTARGRNPTSSLGATDCIPSTSAAVTVPVPDEQRPRKRQKRPSSTPATPQSSQVFVQLRSRSRAGSPATDVEYIPPRRASARLARKLRPFLNGPSSDIYTHLADPDGAGDLLSEPPAGSAASSTPNEIASSQPVQKRRGRRKRAVDLADENTKKDLIKEWARMRQSQGTLSLSSLDEGTRFSPMQLCSNREGDVPLEVHQSQGSLSLSRLDESARFGPMQLRSTREDDESLEPIAQTHSSDAYTTKTQVMTLDDPPPPQMNAEDTLSANDDRNKTNHILPSESGIEQSIAPGVDIEPPAPLIPSPRVGNGSLNGEQIPETTHDPDSSQYLVSPQVQSVPPVREESAVPTSEQAVSLDGPSRDSHLDVLSPLHSLDKSSMHLDSDQEFYMLDVSEILAFPWEPVASHLYVPPGLGKLISGMREQLAVEARARRRAEDLYQAELSRRIAAEMIIEDLREELERQEKTPAEDIIGTHQDGSK